MSRRSRLEASLFAVVLVPYAWLVHRYWFVCDDAFITFRYSQNLALGHGPVYNLGVEPPVEGYSNFLWMLLAAAFEAMGAAPDLWVPWFSVAAGVALLGAVYHLLVRQLEVALPIAVVATLIPATFAPFATWSTSGLATMPQALFTFLTWMFLSTRDDERAPVWAGVSGLLLALTRTEGIAWCVVLAGLAIGQRLLQGRPIKRPLLTYAAIVGVGYGAYFGWRASFYEAWVANTAKAKVHTGLATLRRGLDYLLLYLTTMLSPLVLLASIPLSWRHPVHRLTALSAGAMAVGVPAYAVVVSGDYMAWFRILVPGVAFLAVSVALGLDAVARRREGFVPTAAVLGLAVAVLGFLPSQGIHLVPESVREPLQVRDKLPVFRDENTQWQAMVNHGVTWREKGEALAAYAEPGETYVAAAIGNVGYYSRLTILDRNGLVNREVAEQPWTGQLRSPGHDKVVDRSFFYDHKPDILDSKVVHGPAVVPRLKGALREMEAVEVRDRYFPDLLELEPVDFGRRAFPRYLVALRRADNDRQLQRGWRQYKRAVSALRGGGDDSADEVN